MLLQPLAVNLDIAPRCHLTGFTSTSPLAATSWESPPRTGIAATVDLDPATAPPAVALLYRWAEGSLYGQFRIRARPRSRAAVGSGIDMRGKQGTRHTTTHTCSSWWGQSTWEANRSQAPESGVRHGCADCTKRVRENASRVLCSQETRCRTPMWMNLLVSNLYVCFGVASIGTEDF